jgi:hypothetical protein
VDPYELMNIGLHYIEKSGRTLSVLPRDYWPTAENLESRRQAVARARVLLSLGEDMCARATPRIVDAVAATCQPPAGYEPVPVALAS